MKQYTVVVMVPVSATVEAYTAGQAAEMAIEEVQKRHSNYPMRPTLLSIQELRDPGVDNETAL